MVMECLERRLAPGESILVEPGAFLYKDASVTMQVELQKLGTGFLGATNMSLAKIPVRGDSDSIDVLASQDRVKANNVLYTLWIASF